VIPRIYNELKLEFMSIKVTKFLVVKFFMWNFHLHDLYLNKKKLFLCYVTPTNSEKVTNGQQDVVCIYCGGKWFNKLRISKHKHKGCKNAPFYLNSSKQV
jgi:hypothetical protein